MLGEVMLATHLFGGCCCWVVGERKESSDNGSRDAVATAAVLGEGAGDAWSCRFCCQMSTVYLPAAEAGVWSPFTHMAGRAALMGQPLGLAGGDTPLSVAPTATQAMA